MGNQRPVLSISMLASDRLDTLPRCLESLTAIREAIPSELIIVDTSKNPAVHDLIVKYADKIEVFEWCDDFAKARNVGLNMAEGEWFMFIDDDEWFAEPEALIDFFRSGEYKEYGYAHHRIKNFHDPEFTVYTYAWVSRLMKIEEGLAFHSKVHEHFNMHNGKGKHIEATSYHSGYVFQTEEEKQKHFERNIKLLKKMEEEEPKVLRWKVQMMLEYRVIGAWKEMADYGKRVIEELWAEPDSYPLRAFASLHIGYCIALNQLQRYEEVEQVYVLVKEALEEAFISRAYMELCVAESYWGRYMYVEAREHVSEYLERYHAYMANPQDYDTGEVYGVITGDAVGDRHMHKAYNLLLHTELCLGNAHRLEELLPHLGWEKPEIHLFYGTEKEIVRVLLEKKDEKLSNEVLQRAFRSRVIRSKMWEAIHTCKETYDTKPADLYLYLDLKTWIDALNERFEELQMEQVEELRKELEDSALVNDVRFYYFMMIYMEQKALVAEKDALTFDSFTEILAQFSEYTGLYYETLYEVELQQASVEEWPKRYQAAKWLQIFFAEVGNDMKSALGCLAKVIGAYPRLAESMKYYLKRIEIDVLNG